MAVEDVVAVGWIAVISCASISRVSPQIRHEVDAERLWSWVNALSAADAAAIRVCIDGTCEHMIDRRRKQQIWTVVIDRIGRGFARRDKPGPRTVAANEVVTAAVEVDMGCTVDGVEHLDGIGVARDREALVQIEVDRENGGGVG